MLMTPDEPEFTVCRIFAAKEMTFDDDDDDDDDYDDDDDDDDDDDNDEMPIKMSGIVLCFMQSISRGKNKQAKQHTQSEKKKLHVHFKSSQFDFVRSGPQ
ncbi:hypothetical protein PoB_005151700 [Plakobranchus ocellatus]|uniref:Uncharacterized protein n=1 Tax=Plakobranchus ocellatus TaxID=259542 RepID=A0AAV4C0Y1_9GAST|nr:hypothetical protein PoB_005151700 [Plakobranchus ocellatus]